MDRLTDISGVESSRNSPSWQTMSPEQRKAKMDFYHSQQTTCGGFMNMAVANLAWLNTLSADPTCVSQGGQGAGGRES